MVGYPAEKWPDGGLRRHPAIGLLIAVLLVGLGARLYRLDKQGTTLIELAAVDALDSPTVGDFLLRVDYNGLHHPSLYHVLEFGWSRVVGTSTLRVRLLSVSLGVAALLLVYGCASRLYERKTALLAMLLAALSPVQIHHAQSIHSCALILPLGLVSVYALARRVEGGGDAWTVLNVVANALLLLVHLYGGLLIVAEFVFLLLSGVYTGRRLIGWLAMLLGVAAFPIGLAWTGIACTPTGELGPATAYQPLRTGRIVADFVADDALVLNPPGDMAYAPANVQPTFPRVGPSLASFGLAAAFAAGLALFIRRLIRSRHPEAATTAHPPRRSDLLMLCIAFVPPLVLLAVSLVFVPCFIDGTTSYSAIALNIAVASVFVRLRRRAVRRAAILGLIALYACQACLFLSSVRRPDWFAITRLLEHRAQPNDVLLVQDWMPPAIEHHVVPCLWETRQAVTLQALCEDAETILDAPDSQRNVWLMFGKSADISTVIKGFEPCLTSRGLAYERHELDTLPNVFVYRVTRNPDWRPAPGHQPTDVPAPVDYEQMMANLGLDVLPAHDRELALSHLRRTVEWDLQAEYAPAICTRIAEDLYLQAQDPRLVGIFATHAQDLGAGEPLLHLVLAIAYAEQGDVEAAERAFRKAADGVGERVKRLEPLFQATYVANDYEVARAAARQLEADGYDIPPFIAKRLGLQPHDGRP